mgnify:FL=1
MSTKRPFEACSSSRSYPNQRDDERIVYHLGKVLYEDRRVEDALSAEAVSTLGELAVVELTGVFGYYALVAMALNVFAVLRNVAAPLPFS